MNDFLHQLRNGNLGRFNQKRRYHDNGHYKTYDRKNGNGNDNKKYQHPHHVEPELESSLQNATATEIKTLLQNVVDNQRLMLEAEDRKIIALESIAVCLNQLVSANETPAAETCPEEKQETLPTAPEDNKEKLFEIIKTMRADNATYPQIASFLEDENIPTLSGKGKWNAQAVRRCAVKLN